MLLVVLVLGHVISICVHCESTANQKFDVTMCATSRDPVYGGKLINCSGLGIRKLPLNEIPDNTTTLILDYNNFSRLHNHSFYVTSLSSLRHLNIQFSEVAEIEVDALFGLDSLEILNLEYNNLSLCRGATASFPAGVFKHVPNLHHLFIGYNTLDYESSSECQTYTEHIDIFSSLPQLTNLSIDTVNTTLYLGHEFSNLTYLTNLTVVCNQVWYITNSSLEGLGQLQVKILRLVNFKKEMVTFELDVFENLPYLESLTFDGSHVGNHNIMDALRPLANRNMTALNLRETNFYATYSVPSYALDDGIIGFESAMYLRSICLTHFAWTDSILFAFKPKSLTSDAWPECIRTIDLSHNKLENTGWLTVTMEARRLKYLSEVTLSSFASPPSDQYPKLIHFNFLEDSTRDVGDVQNSNLLEDSARDDDFMHNVNKDTVIKANTNSHITNFQQSSNHSYHNKTRRDIQIVNNSIEKGYHRKDIHNIIPQGHSPFSIWQSRDLEKSRFPYNGNITYYFLPSLRKVKIINMIFGPLTIGSWTIVCKSNDNFEELYWINNNILEAKGVIYGVEKVKVLDLTGSLFKIADHLFDTFHGLQVFVLSDMKPDTLFKKISVQRLLRNLTDLRYLDVSNNKLNSLLFPPTTFSSTPNITHVILSQNRFSNIPFDLTTTPKLQVLDLSANAILFLTDDEMEALNSHVTKVGNFLLRLQDNAIACVCSQIKFMGEHMKESRKLKLFSSVFSKHVHRIFSVKICQERH